MFSAIGEQIDRAVYAAAYFEDGDRQRYENKAENDDKRWFSPFIQAFFKGGHEKGNEDEYEKSDACADNEKFRAGI